MSCSKPLPPFVCDLLYYLNRDQLERFSIVCRPLKNFIDRYLHSKPYRVFDQLWIRGGLYALRHNRVKWHPNQDDYSAQQFLAGHICSVDESKRWNDHTYYSFSEKRLYLGMSVRINVAIIAMAGDFTYDPEHIVEMESITHLWRDGEIFIWNVKDDDIPIGAEDFQPILNSPTILQCQKMVMADVHFSFKDYNILYTLKVIEINYAYGSFDPNYWPEFFEQPGFKPLVALHDFGRKNISNALDRLKGVFLFAVLPNAFKVVFSLDDGLLTEFRETNRIFGEKLELKKGLPVEHQKEYLQGYDNFTLERSSI